MCAAVTFVQRMCSTSAIPVGDDVARVGNANLDRVAFGNSPRRPVGTITPIFISSAFPVGRGFTPAVSFGFIFSSRREQAPALRVR